MKKKLYLISIIISSSLTFLSFIFLFLAGLDKKGYSFATMHMKLFQMLARFSRNIPHCIVVILIFAIFLAMAIFMTVKNIQRNQYKMIALSAIPLVSGYVTAIYVSYFFTGIYGCAFPTVALSYIGLIVSILGALSSVLLFLVDLLFGHKKVLYVIQDPLPGINIF